MSLVKERVRKGIPAGLRHLIWPIICDFESLKKEVKFIYFHLIEASQYPCEEEINKDVIRTFAENIYFKRGVGKVSGKNDLKSVQISSKNTTLPQFYQKNI